MSKEYLGMSDEDFLNQTGPADSSSEAIADEGPGETPGQSAVQPEQTQQIEETPDEGAAADPGSDVPGDAAASAADDDAGGETPGAGEPGSKPEDEPKPEGAEAAAAGAGSEGQPAADAGQGEVKPEGEGEPKPVDHVAFYNQVMAPFKANGKTFTPQTPEEAIRLMQMGAGYGRKLQDLQPHLKTLRMLEKNSLLDETEISYLIDLKQGNPEAIKKLIKDSGIDPLDLNVEDNVNYIPQNHAVSDREMAFQDVVAEVRALEGGQETIRTINQTWDQQSCAVIWENPEVLKVIQSHRENGHYDKIATEIDRQKLLGNIPAGTPFLKAYHAVGTSMFPDLAQTGQTPQPSPSLTPAPAVNQGTPQPQPQVIATRPGQPKPQVSNNDKARAASPTQTTPKKAATVVNPLELADDEFLKQFGNRL